ncbi:MAG: hypothetical protein ACI30I_09365 [Parabacteroides sp.]
MKQLALSFLFVVSMLCGHQVLAQAEYGYFNSLGVGVSASTLGIGVDVATPVGNYLALRGGVSFMPGITVKDQVDVTLQGLENIPGYSSSASMDVEGSLKRATGEILLNLYPFRSNGLFIAAGASFGGNKLVKLSGHSDAMRDLIAAGGSAGLEIGDVTIPVDKNGDVDGGLKVSSVRPYVGIGYGRAVPSKRVNFLLDLGVQIHGTPEVYAETGNVSDLMREADNDFTDIINHFKVYPVLKLRISGKLF